jgi:NAD(P)H-hydrate epimerase
VHAGLKGARTVIAEAGGFVWINSSGNPGMASGGMGDVLAGAVGGLLAQRLPPAEAACLGVYVHGLAADRAARTARSASSPATSPTRCVRRSVPWSRRDSSHRQGRQDRQGIP